MMDSKPKTDAKPAAKSEAKAHYATRDFKDAGTTRYFERGAELTDVSVGELVNYRAAGLASLEKPKSPAEAEKAALDEALG
jgi:hypothetical protein